MQSLKYIIVLMLLVRAVENSNRAEWSYFSLGNTRASDSWNFENPNEWANNYPQCNGSRQSPIPLGFLSSSWSVLSRLTFTNYNTQLQGPLTLINNGHTVEMEVLPTVDGRRPTISGGYLPPGMFEAVNVHFHWGSPTTNGAEHTINNKRYNVEMHIVHRNSKYPTMAEALNNKDGIGVLGIFLKLVQQTSNPNPQSGLNSIINTIPEVMRYESEAQIPSTFPLKDLLDDIYTNRFFAYKGSLTTPPCSEVVTWHVFPQPIQIEMNQLDKFFHIYDEQGRLLLNTFRPLQPTNGRTVYYEFF